MFFFTIFIFFLCSLYHALTTRVLLFPPHFTSLYLADRELTKLSARGENYPSPRPHLRPYRSLSGTFISLFFVVLGWKALVAGTFASLLSRAGPLEHHLSLQSRIFLCFFHFGFSRHHHQTGIDPPIHSEGEEAKHDMFVGKFFFPIF